MGLPRHPRSDNFDEGMVSVYYFVDVTGAGSWKIEAPNFSLYTSLSITDCEVKFKFVSPFERQNAANFKGPDLNCLGGT